MQSNPALLAALFITSVTVAPKDETTPDPIPTVHLSDGSSYPFLGFVEPTDEAPRVLRVELGIAPETPDQPGTVALGPIVSDEARAMFGAISIDVPAVSPVEPTPAALVEPGMTEEEAARQRAIVEAGNAAAEEALEAQRQAAAPKVEGEPIEAGDREDGVDPQVHVNRMHQLLDVVERELHSGAQWAVKEFRVILRELGAHPRDVSE